MTKKDNIFDLAEMKSDWGEPMAIVRIKLWDKSITLVRTHHNGNMMIPLETIWEMFNLDVDQESERLCRYPLVKTGMTWVKLDPITSQRQTLYMDVDVLPYYLSTVPTVGMNEESAQILIFISEVARGHLADFFRLGKNNLDRRLDYLHGIEEYSFEMRQFKKDLNKGEDEDSIPF
jgi:hypothetical protein